MEGLLQHSHPNVKSCIFCGQAKGGEDKCEQRRAQELPYQASPFVHLCQDPHVNFQMAQHKHRLLAPRSPSCSPAGAVWCRKLQVASSYTKMVGRNALNPAASQRPC